MAISIARDITKLIAFSLNQIISGLSDYVHVIDLGRDDWEAAYITLSDPTPPISRDTHKSIFAIATRDIDEAFSQSVYDRKVFMPKGYIVYVIDNWDYVGFSYLTDAKLSKPSYGYDQNWIYLKDAWIDGNDLKIKWHNNYGASKTLEIEGTARASRVKLK